MKDYLQLALTTFNGGMWYGWKKYNDDGSRIPDAERKNYENIIVIKDGAIKPTKQELEDRIEQLKTEHEQKIAQQEANKQSALNKLKALGLNDAEIKAIIGI